MLKFVVKGSSGKPYIVSAHGEGESLKIFCTCPAGSKGGYFCKHIASVLVGEISNLLSGEESIELLAGRAAKTDLYKRALAHKPRSSKRRSGPRECDWKFKETKDISVACASEIETFKQIGWHVTVEPNSILLRGYFKNGKLRKTPIVYLIFDEEEIIEFADGTVERKRRSRPFGVGGAGASTTLTMLGDALDRMKQYAEECRKEFLPV